MSRKFEYDICVVGGCGHVGLPLAICFAKEGKRVIAFDIDEKAVKIVSSGEMPFKDDGADGLLKGVVQNESLKATTSATAISQSENIIFVLGTPVSNHLYPTYSDFFKSIEQYLDYFKNDQLVILRSTIYPGCTRKVQDLFDQKKIKVDVSFCPERVAEGYAIKETYELPQIVSAFNPRVLERAKDLFSLFTKDLVELEPMEAELAKLFTNTWRYIKFSIANQFYMVANNQGLDFYKIYEAMTHNYPRAKDLPKAGFSAGPCLFKDTMQLASFHDNNLFLGHSAMLVNEGMPSYLMSCLKKKHNLSKKTIGILGMAFKGDSDDKRESLSYKLRNILGKECKEVLTTDPYIQNPDFLPAEEVIKRSDILILAAPHQTYRDLPLKNKEVVDIWNFYGKGGLV